MWLSLYFPSLNATIDEHRVVYGASLYGMPIIVHHDDATVQHGQFQSKIETFHA